MNTHCDTWVMGVSSVSPSRSRSSAKLFVLKKWGVLTSSSVGLFLTVKKVWDSSLGFSRNLIMKGLQNWTELDSNVHPNLIMLWDKPMSSQDQVKSEDRAYKFQPYASGWFTLSGTSEWAFKLVPRYPGAQPPKVSHKGWYILPSVVDALGLSSRTE